MSKYFLQSKNPKVKTQNWKLFKSRNVSVSWDSNRGEESQNAKVKTKAGLLSIL